MSISTNIVSVLTTDIPTTVITLIIGFIVYKLSKFYLKVYISLPPGPIPLPILGNMFQLRGNNEHWNTQIERMGDKYGPVFTLWMGMVPVVFISDIDIGREAFRRNDFAGRNKTVFSKIFNSERHTNIVQADYGHQWEALRRVAHSAVQKYSTSDRLVYLVSDCVDHTIDAMIEKEGFNKPFVPLEYIYNMFLNIMAASVFGRRYELDDPEYKAIKYIHKDWFREFHRKILLWQFLPFLVHLDHQAHNKMKNNFQEFIDLMTSKLQGHYKDYDESVIRDFCDTLISAKNDALREGKESAPYLEDGSLVLAIFDLLTAGTDTSQNIFRWILFLMKYFPEVENKLRQEIECEIGDRIPTHEDRDRCHYVMAVISETLRLKNIIPRGVNHKAVVTSKIGNHTIPKGTEVTVFQGHIMHKEEYWPNAQEFRPERFLENGKYITTRNKAFIPFGVGRRVCLGQRLALADLFLVVVRFIQKTADYELVFHYSGDHKPDPNRANEYHPKPYEISLKSKCT